MVIPTWLIVGPDDGSGGADGAGLRRGRYRDTRLGPGLRCVLNVLPAGPSLRFSSDGSSRLADPSADTTRSAPLIGFGGFTVHRGTGSYRALACENPFDGSICEHDSRHWEYRLEHQRANYPSGRAWRSSQAEPPTSEMDKARETVRT